mgnify:CR=1 FL=1
MKTIKSSLSILCLLIFGLTGFAQEVDLTKGDLSFLKGETTINIEFSFEKMAVGDFSKEADYIKKKIEEYNTKEAGTGDSWAVKWEDDKKNKFPPKFILGFTNLSTTKVSADAKYT